MSDRDILKLCLENCLYYFNSEDKLNYYTQYKVDKKKIVEGNAAKV